MTEVTRATVEEAQTRLQAIVDELAAEAKRDVPREQFYRTFLSGLASALQSDAAAAYESTPAGFRRAAHVGEAAEDAEAGDVAKRRDLVRQEAITRREALWLPPRDAVADDARANEADRILLIAPLSPAGELAGVVELKFRSIASATVQRACMRFMAQVAIYVDEYLLRERVRGLLQKQNVWDEALAFVQKIHSSVELKRTSYDVANEGRRLLDCDALTVLRRRGRHYRVLAISGQDMFDVRSPAVKALRTLTEAVAATGEPMTSDAPPGTLPPNLEEALAHFVDESHAKHVAVVPLMPPKKPVDPAADESGVVPETPKPIGALVVERRQAPAAAIGAAERLHFVAEHSAAALGNALEQERIFLLPVWRAIGKAKHWVLAPGTRTKAWVIIGAIVSAIAALFFVPADFNLQAGATFQPVERRDVFAPSDAVVKELYVRHGSRVEAGAPLVLLRSTEIELAITTAEGEFNSASEQYIAVKNALLGKGLTDADRIRLGGQRLELEARVKSSAEKLQTLKQKQNRLLISSPLAGEVITWDVERLLNDRPVKQGQALFTVADPTREWELEVYLPEHYVGHLIQAQKATGKNLTVTFRPTSDPSSEFTGTIKEVHGAAEIRGERGNTVLVTVQVDVSKLPPLKPGAEAAAKVYCGERSLGYVWLHDVADFLRTKVWFRMY